MSETAIFSIGAAIFTITVYGSAMASMARTVTRLGTKENDSIDRRVDPTTASEGPETER
jgi:hypothetical protein